VGCCAAFRLGSLGKLAWFKFNGTAVLDFVNAAIPTGLFSGYQGIPPGWLKPARKQLPLPELEQRCTITWDVPRADLQSLLQAESYSRKTSHVLYVAGTGVRLSLSASAGKKPFGVFLRLADFIQHGFTLCSARLGLSCQFTISRQVPGQEEPSVISHGDATVTADGWGIPSLITASTPADLEPHLVDGQLKLKAIVSMIPG
jgi:hypothetical protein